MSPQPIPIRILIPDTGPLISLALAGELHVVSTASWLEGLEEIGVIPSAADVRARILRRRPYFRVDYREDTPAGKIEGGTEWRSRFGKSKS